MALASARPGRTPVRSLSHDPHVHSIRALLARPIIRIAACIPLAFTFASCARATRFQFDLRDSPDLPAAARSAIDSLQAIDDRVNHCPPRPDTLWAADPRGAIPRVWLDASVSQGCRYSGLPNAVRRRLRDDPSSLRYYEAVAGGALPRGEFERATAVVILRWNGRRRFLPLFLRVANGAIPETSEENAAYEATLSLAPFLNDSRAARRTVLRHASDPSSGRARQAAILTLATANSPWSRRVLERMHGRDEGTTGFVRNALAHRPCRPGTIFVEWFGIEGQNYSKCEPPPDFR